jgi:hypothetical protein
MVTQKRQVCPALPLKYFLIESVFKMIINNDHYFSLPHALCITHLEK